MHIDDHDKAEMVAHYAKAARAAGRDPAEARHTAAVLAQVADDDIRARRALQASMPGWLGEGLAAHVPLGGHRRPSRDPVAYTRLLCDLHPVGSPQLCVDRLRSGVEITGIDHVVMMVEGTGDHGRTLDNIARLGAEVLPHL
jgi:alkanesulfonate monooxygenase SsuD/methylene tetrahydromethanopterin reductase-like flavin-dependent oxidoreductase (luciferase family)